MIYLYDVYNVTTHLHSVTINLGHFSVSTELSDLVPEEDWSHESTDKVYKRV